MNWVKWSTALLGLVGLIWAGSMTLATKDEVKEAKAETVGKIVLVENDFEVHKLEDQSFYMNKQMWWYIQTQPDATECKDLTNVGTRMKCQELEVKVKNLEDRKKEALGR